MFDLINKWLINRLPSRRLTIIRLIATDSGLLVNSRDGVQTIQWSDVSEVVATRADQLIGNLLLLCISLNDGRVLTVLEDMAGWLDLAEALPKYLVNAKRYEDWALHIAFTDEPKKVLIFRRKE